MVAQASRLKQFAAATALTLAAGVVNLSGQNVHAETRSDASESWRKCLQGADEELLAQFKKIDAVGGTLAAIDLKTTGGVGTLTYGAVSAIVGCIKGPARPDETPMDRFYREQVLEKIIIAPRP
ncbi:MAG: hypothetical protein WBK91_08295 [Alphaproteobacteria bacterium]